MNHAMPVELDWLHILLALGIMTAYLAIPFTAISALPLPPVVRYGSIAFFLTCALTHLGIAVGFHDSPWMILNDLVQFISVTTTVVYLSRMAKHALEYRRTFATAASTPPVEEVR